MDLSLIPFSENEKLIPYEVSEFIEDDVPIRMIIDSSKKPCNGTYYAFGAINATGEKFWYFKGKSLAENREKMIEIMKALNGVTLGRDLKPFTLKVRK